MPEPRASAVAGASGPARPDPTRGTARRLRAGDAGRRGGREAPGSGPLRAGEERCCRRASARPCCLPRRSQSDRCAGSPVSAGCEAAAAAGGREGGSEPARPRAAGATVGSGRPPRCPEVTAALPGCAAPAGQPEGPGGPFCTFAGVRAARRGPLRLLFPTKGSKILFNEPQFLAGTY